MPLLMAFRNNHVDLYKTWADSISVTRNNYLYFKIKSVNDRFINSCNVPHRYGSAIGKLCIGPKNTSKATEIESLPGCYMLCCA